MKLTRILPLALCASLFFASCDDDDNNDMFIVPTIVETNFSNQYPNTTVEEWDQEGQYFVAEFLHHGNKAEAWYTSEGIWAKTEFDFFGTLPEAVSSYIAQNYAGYRIDEKLWVESPITNYYKVELERGNSDIDLSILEDGMVINIEGQHIDAPLAVKDSFNAHYPNMLVKEWELKNQQLIAEFNNNGLEADAYFTLQGIWIKTATEFHGSLPNPVTVFITNNYPKHRIDDIYWVETPDKEYFDIELEKDNSEIILSINEYGGYINAVPKVD